MSSEKNNDVNKEIVVKVQDENLTVKNNMKKMLIIKDQQ